MKGKLRQLVGVPVLVIICACNEGTTAVRTATSLPSYQWWETLPPPPPLSVHIVPPADMPNNGWGTYTWTATVDEPGTYTYRWFVRECNWNDGAEWCPSNFVDTYEEGTSLAYFVGEYDTHVDFVVEVQQVSSADVPPTGKSYSWSAGPMFGAEGSSGGGGWCGPLTAAGGYPLSRHELNPDTQQWVWVNYRRNQCSGVSEVQPPA